MTSSTTTTTGLGKLIARRETAHAAAPCLFGVFYVKMVLISSTREDGQASRPTSHKQNSLKILSLGESVR